VRRCSCLDEAAISAGTCPRCTRSWSTAGRRADLAWGRLVGLHLDVISFDAAQARAAADLRSLVRTRGLSFADRTCLAAARTLGLPAITADRSWSEVALDIELQLIR
jgi:PIN domain nuclease of toxin-antitoxin system